MNVVLRNGIVRTLDARGSVLDEVGVAGGRFVPATAVRDGVEVDLGGRCVVPGFSDSHVHFATWALVQHQLRLEHATSVGDVVARVERALPADGWLRGYGWREGDWADPRITREDADRLDAVSGNTPVVLT